MCIRDRNTNGDSMSCSGGARVSPTRRLRGLLTEVGYADALLVRELSDGRLMIIDGHLRAETTPDAMVPVLVLDVTDEEADKILLTLDPLAAMAESDAERIKALLRMVGTESDAVQDLLSGSPDRNFGEFCIPRTSTRPRSHPTAPRSFRRNGVPNWARSGRLARIASSAATAPTSTSSRA